jgi:hypothetical protein
MPMQMTPPSNQLPHGMKPKKKYEPEVQLKRANWNKVDLFTNCFLIIIIICLFSQVYI